ncbi:MAG: hypothetical protein AB1700_13060, partial [Bacillota bacterium]
DGIRRGRMADRPRVSQSSMLRHARGLAGAGLPGIAVKHECYKRCRKTPSLRLPAMTGYGSNCLGRV